MSDLNVIIMNHLRSMENTLTVLKRVVRSAEESKDQSRDIGAILDIESKIVDFELKLEEEDKNEKM